MHSGYARFPLACLGVALLSACGGGGSGGDSGNAPQAAATPPPVVTQSCLDDVPPLAERSLVDRADDVAGSQLHFVYAIPADAEDRTLDTDGQIQVEAKVAQRWIQEQTGRCLQMDTFAGALDVTYMQFSRTNEQIRAHPDFVDQTIKLELEVRGFDDPQKVYVVFYGGSADNGGCGGAAQIGGPAMQYLAGQRADGGGLATCSFFAFSSGPDAAFRGTWAGVAVHETFHALGIVPFCAPDHEDTNPLHLRTITSDLMASNGGNFATYTLDANRDQYYDHDNDGCRDLADSAIWTDAPAMADPLPNRFSYGTPTFIACADEPTTQSGSSTNGATIRFVNGTEEPLFFYPLDDSGVRQQAIMVDPFSDLETGATEEQVFVATNGNSGECLGLYRIVPDAGTNRILITD